MNWEDIQVGDVLFVPNGRLLLFLGVEAEPFRQGVTLTALDLGEDRAAPVRYSNCFGLMSLYYTVLRGSQELLESRR